MLGVPVQLAIATSERSANAQAARRTPRPAVLHIPSSAIANAARIQAHTGGSGVLGEGTGAEAKVAALVWNVTVEVAEPFAAGVTEFCEKVAVESPGKEPALKVMGEENPAIELTVIVAVTVPCVPTVADVGDAEIVKSGCDATPVPESATV